MYMWSYQSCIYCIITFILLLSLYTLHIYQDPYSVLDGITISDDKVVQFINNNEKENNHLQKNNNSYNTRTLRKSKFQMRLETFNNELVKNSRHSNRIGRSVNYKELEYVKSDISNQGLAIYKDRLSHYLHKLCKNHMTLPLDCTHLLSKMLNISIMHGFSLAEVNVLAQRIEYLSNIMPQRMPYLFIHVPKTAGTSLAYTFQKEFKKRFYHYWSQRAVRHRNMNNILNGGYSFMIFGHLAYGFHKAFITDKDRGNRTWRNKLNYTYATVVRHPLSRVKSHFYYHREKRSDPNHRWTKNKSLLQWVGYMEDSKDCSVVHIAGVHSQAWWNAADESVKLLPHRNEAKAPRKDWIVTRKHYEMARWNLMNMGWVGIFDRLAESVQQLESLWNMKQTRMWTMNANKKKPQNPLTAEETEKILAFNPGDVWLYELAVILFEQQKLVLKYTV